MSASPVFGLLTILVIASLASSKGLKATKYNDHCHSKWMQGARDSGEFDIKLPNITRPIKLHCNFTSGASYVVIQRRLDGIQSFNRGWVDYKHGFGHPQGDYWAGLDTISHLTYTGYSLLHIDMQDWSKPAQKAYAYYQQFYVQNEANYYRMTVSNIGYQGNVPDDLSYHSGNYFFTPDRVDQYNCAKNMGAGWWFYYCSYANLNGRYYPNGPYYPNPAGFYDGIYWKDWAGFNYSLKFATMTLYYTR